MEDDEIQLLGRERVEDMVDEFAIANVADMMFKVTLQIFDLLPKITLAKDLVAWEEKDFDSEIKSWLDG